MIVVAKVAQNQAVSSLLDQVGSSELAETEETELVIAQRLLACILARRLDDIHLSSDLKIKNEKEECPGL